MKRELNFRGRKFFWKREKIERRVKNKKKISEKKIEAEYKILQKER
jgi:hypothetical protein